jgi:hypothetical protein
MGHQLFSAGLAVALAFCLIRDVRAEVSQQEDAPLPAPSRYVRTLGPFPIEGQEFTVKLRVTCYKESKHAGMCDEDDEETVSSVEILDASGKVHFKKPFPIPLARQAGRHLVDVTLLEGQKHQALELTYEDLSVRASRGKSIQLFGVQDGTLRPLDPEPLAFQGGLADLPPGQSANSKHLFENDTLRIYALTTYFYIVTPVRVNWEEFRLERQDSGDFDVANQPPYDIRPEIESERLIQLYPAPDKATKPLGVSLTPTSRILLLKARFGGAPPDKHDSANEAWLKVRIDNQEGWILGVDDYTALGLSFLIEHGAV